jgi:hypothetical protein
VLAELEAYEIIIAPEQYRMLSYIQFKTTHINQNRLMTVIKIPLHLIRWQKEVQEAVRVWTLLLEVKVRMTS